GNRYIYCESFQDFLNQFFQKNSGHWDTNNNQNSDPDNGQETSKQDEKAPEGTGESNNQTDDGDETGQTEEQENNVNNESGQTEEQENITNGNSEEVEEQKDTSDDGQLNEFEKEVVSLTNDERVKNGLEPLKVDAELSVVARDKSKDMRANGYFSHNSPTYGSPFDMMESYGINYRTAGENIARGQRSPEEVVNAWMNSQGHRENIL